MFAGARLCRFVPSVKEAFHRFLFGVRQKKVGNLHFQNKSITFAVEIVIEFFNSPEGNFARYYTGVPLSWRARAIYMARPCHSLGTGA